MCLLSVSEVGKYSSQESKFEDQQQGKVSVCSDFCDKIPYSGQLKQQKLIPQNSGGYDRNFLLICLT